MVTRPGGGESTPLPSTCSPHDRLQRCESRVRFMEQGGGLADLVGLVPKRLLVVCRRLNVTAPRGASETRQGHANRVLATAP